MRIVPSFRSLVFALVISMVVAATSFAQIAWPFHSRRRAFPSTNCPRCPRRVTSGYLAIGPTTTSSATISGSRAPGAGSPSWLPLDAWVLGLEWGWPCFQ